MAVVEQSPSQAKLLLQMMVIPHPCFPPPAGEATEVNKPQPQEQGKRAQSSESVLSPPDGE